MCVCVCVCALISVPQFPLLGELSREREGEREKERGDSEMGDRAAGSCIDGSTKITAMQSLSMGQRKHNLKLCLSLLSLIHIQPNASYMMCKNVNKYIETHSW